MTTKLLFTDLDGTLLNDEKHISLALQEALFTMLDNGHYLVLSSGRPLNSILEVRTQLQLFHPHVFAIAYNGALIYDCMVEKTIHEETISLSDVRLFLDLALKHNLHCHTYSDSHIISERDTKELSFYRTHIHLPYQIVADASTFLSHAPHKLIAIHLQEKDRLVAFQQELERLAGDRISCIFSNDNYLEIFSKKAGKGNAVSTLCNHLQLPVSASVAVGDAQNDASMLQAAHVGVAMANADPDLQDIADVVTKNSNNHDGLLELLKNYHFIT